MNSSLYEFDRLADRIKLERQVRNRPIIVVEGKGDRRYISRIPALSGADVYIAHTRSRVLEAAADLRRLGISGVACVMDRDFDDVVASAELSELAIAAYDNSDLEAMLWASVALDDLLEEVGSEEKLQGFGGADSLRRRAYEVLAPVTRLRRANALGGWGVNFDSVSLAAKIDTHTLSVSVQSLCDSLWSPDLPVEKAELYAAAADCRFDVTCPHTGLELVRGRDALAVTGAALRRLIGSLTHAQASTDRLEETLRLAGSQASAQSSSWLGRVETLLKI